MQTSKTFLFLCFSLLWLGATQAQSRYCEQNFTKYIRIKDKVRVDTKSLPLVTKSDYHYSVEFSATQVENKLQIVTNDVRSMRWNDKIIFESVNGDKKMFDFNERSEQRVIKQELCFSNLIKLSKEELAWMSAHKIKQIRMVSMADRRIYPHSLSPESQDELNKIATCVHNEISK